jgi:chitinase
MKKIALSILACTAFCTAYAAPLFIGYYPDWGKWHKPAYTVDKVPYKKLTHVLWSFITPNADGTLHGDAADDPSALDSMVTLAHAAGTKVIVSLGGGGQSDKFAPVAKDSTLRNKFIVNLVDYVKAHNLDGLDMDWEWEYNPVPEADTIAYNKLLTELREALPKDKSLSAALPCSRYYGKWFTPEVLVKNLDWFGFMTYDMTGDWDEKALFDSPLYPHEGYTTWSWQETFDYWSKRGVPAEKMVFGIPSFGFEFKGATGPGTDFTKGTAKQVAYKDIVTNTDWEYFYDSVAVEPYGVSSTGYVTFEDPHSAAIKSRWVKDNGYAGIMVWEVSHDYIEGIGNPILDSIAVVLHEGTTSIGDFHKKRAIGTRLDASQLQNTQIKRVDALGKSVQNVGREQRWKNRFEFRTER